MHKNPDSYDELSKIIAIIGGKRDNSVRCIRQLAESPLLLLTVVDNRNQKHSYLKNNSASPAKATLLLKARSSFHILGARR